MLAHVFGPEAEWPSSDLIAFSDEFSAGLAVAAYQSGVFPMPLHDTDFGAEMGWWSPMRRGILPLDGVRVTRSLRKMARRYTTTVDQAFPDVLRRCADPSREGSWIDDGIVRVYTELFDAGLVHSVETWDAEGRLVGGLYGVAMGGLFAGESMFHDAEFGRDASKVALLRLVDLLDDGHGRRLLDVQWRTDHLATLGVVEVPRTHYLRRLDRALGEPPIEFDTDRRPGWDAERLRPAAASE